jgi:phage RecT family recombinase
MSNVQKFSSTQLESLLSKAGKTDELCRICGNGNIEKGKTALLREISFAAQAANKSPKLLSATPQSIAQAVYNTVICGLSLNPHMELCDVLPYENSVKDENGNRVNVTEAVMQPRYAGMLKLAADTGAFLDAPFTVCVYKGDYFEPEYGSSPRIVHKPMFKSQKDEDITHVYTVVKLANGGSHFNIMTADRINAIRNKSKSYTFADSGNPSYGGGKKNSTWHLNYPEMAMKTSLKRTLKTVPKSSFNMEAQHKLAMAIGVDNSDTDFSLPENAAKTVPAETVERIMLQVQKFPTKEEVEKLRAHLETQGIDPQQSMDILARAQAIVDGTPLDAPAQDEVPTVNSGDLFTQNQEEKQ